MNDNTKASKLQVQSAPVFPSIWNLKQLLSVRLFPAREALFVSPAGRTILREPSSSQGFMVRAAPENLRS